MNKIKSIQNREHTVKLHSYTEQLKKNKTIIKHQDGLYLWEKEMGDNYWEKVGREFLGQWLYFIS